MIAQMKELYWDAEDRSRATHILNEEDISRFRCLESVPVCHSISGWLFGQCILNTILVFKNRDGSQVRIKSRVSNRLEKESLYGVILCGDFVFDVKYSDDLIKTDEFIRELVDLNPNLELCSDAQWWTDEGHAFPLTLGRLIEYSKGV